MTLQYENETIEASIEDIKEFILDPSTGAPLFKRVVDSMAPHQLKRFAELSVNFHSWFKVKQTKARIDNICYESYRASHLCVCDTCNELYINHAIDVEVRKYYPELVLHILCNGNRVKL